MAYDCDMSDCVDLLDQKSKNLFPFIKPKPRDPRLRHPILPFAPPPLDEGIREGVFASPEEMDKLIEQERERLSAIKESELRAEEATQDPAEKTEGKKSKRKKENGDNDSVFTGKSKQTFSDLNLSNDELSQVFGRDEGYETMSPISPLVPHRFDFSVPDFSKSVSVRGTRASLLTRAHNATKVENLRLRAESAKNCIGAIGSYNFESRRWRAPRSAPQERNYSVESTPRSVVRVGLPFIHGQDKKKSSVQVTDKQRAKTAGSGRERVSFSSDPGRTGITKYRSKSAHSNISPYSQVAKLLEQSRLFSPLMAKTQLPMLNKMKSHSVNNDIVTKTRINYIYADRGPAKSRCQEVHSTKTDLLPKRKLKI